MGSYVPMAQGERRAMLDAVGLAGLEELFQDVPAGMRCGELDLPPGKSELEVRRTVEAMAAKNTVFPTVLRGAGAYRHYIPAIVKQVAAKETFVTAYTPYQAEMSQGVLQVIFEYQTEICALTGMDASNASVYDGPSAAAEAVAMCRERNRETALVSAASHPDTLAVVQTYCDAADAPVQLLPAKDGKTDLDALQAALDGSVACVYIQSPNYFGIIEDVAAIAEIVHQAGARLVVGCNPIALAQLACPGELGADIAVGDGQPLGLPLGFGGPYLGFMACKLDMLRRLPGRIVGETTDLDGNRCFVLTLQAREQHIRREKALSSICSNQALCALTATAYLAAMGPVGLAEAAGQCAAKAHYLAGELAKAGFERLHTGAFFHEFATSCPTDCAKLLAALQAEGILGGLPVEGGLLWCCTELVTKQEMDRAVQICKEVAAG